MTDRMTNAKKPTAAMELLDLLEKSEEALSDCVTRLFARDQREAGMLVSQASATVGLIAQHLASLEPAAHVEDGEVVVEFENTIDLASGLIAAVLSKDARAMLIAANALNNQLPLATKLTKQARASQPPAADALVAAAIHLRRSGDDAIVSIILPDGREVELIRERADGCFGHIIEPSGIARAVKEARCK